MCWTVAKSIAKPLSQRMVCKKWHSSKERSELEITLMAVKQAQYGIERFIFISTGFLNDYIMKKTRATPPKLLN